MHIIFVDFENVAQIDLPRADGVAMSLVLLVGQKQKSLKSDLVEQLLARAGQVEFVRVDASSRNALDLTLAYHLGRLVGAHPMASFHIVSEDKDYDALVRHLNRLGKALARWESWEDLPFLSAAPLPAKTPLPPRVPSAQNKSKIFVENLRKAPGNRPKKESALRSHLKSHLGPEISDDVVEREMKVLVSRYGIAIDAQGLVSYPESWAT